MHLTGIEAGLVFIAATNSAFLFLIKRTLDEQTNVAEKQFDYIKKRDAIEEGLRVPLTKEQVARLQKLLSDN